MKSIEFITEEEKLGDCYKKAFDMVKGLSSEAELVHGYVTVDGNRFPHVWVELGNKGFDYSMDNKAIVDKNDYYSTFKIENPNKYKQKEVLLKAVKNKHYGPWD